MDVHVSVNESHCSDLLVLKLPDVDLRRRGGRGRVRRGGREGGWKGERKEGRRDGEGGGEGGKKGGGRENE